MTTTVTSSPIVKIAAGALIIVCGVAAATMTGLIPNVLSQEKAAEPAEVQTASTAANVTAPARAHPAHTASAPAPIKAAVPVCTDCGVIESVNPIEVKAEPTGAGAVLGGLAGLVVGNQIGHGKGKTLARIAGAAGGAYAGHTIEKNSRKKTAYDVTVRMDDGSYRTITLANAEGLSTGSHVKVNGDSIALN